MLVIEIHKFRQAERECEYSHGYIYLIITLVFPKQDYPPNIVQLIIYPIYVHSRYEKLLALNWWHINKVIQA